MHPRQGYAHSPFMNKPQSYFSRILLPDERFRGSQTPQNLKRPPVDTGSPTLPRNSKRQLFRSQLIPSPHTNYSGGDRMPSLFDFQPDPSYSSTVFKRRLQQQGRSQLQSQTPKPGYLPTEPVTQSKETFERALRILDSKKRTPLHLETDFSPSPDDLTPRNSSEQDPKRRRILTDLASVGSTKENVGFQFTSLDELKRQPIQKEPVNLNELVDKNGHCSLPPSSTRRILDAEGLSLQPANKTPVHEICTPSTRTPKSASAVRRLIPYLSPAELDALFFGQGDRDSRDSVDEVSDGEEEFCALSKSRKCQSSPVAIREEKSTMRDASTVSRVSVMSDTSTSSNSEAAPDSQSVPRVGSVARFIANLEARGRKLSPLAGSASMNRSNSVSSSPLQSGLPYRSPSEVSLRVNRIRQLLSEQTDQTAGKQSSPLSTYSIPFSSVSVAGTTTAAVSISANAASVSTTPATSIPLALGFTLPTGSTGISAQTTTSSTNFSNSSAVSLSTGSVTAASSLSVVSTDVPSFSIPKTTDSASVVSSAAGPTNTVVASSNTAFKFGFPSTTSTNNTIFSAPTVTSIITTNTGVVGLSVPASTRSSVTSTAPSTTAGTGNTAVETAVTSATSSVALTSVTQPADTSGSSVKIPFSFGTSPAISSTASAAITSIVTQSIPVSSSSLFNFKAPASLSVTTSVPTTVAPVTSFSSFFAHSDQGISGKSTTQLTTTTTTTTTTSTNATPGSGSFSTPFGFPGTSFSSNPTSAVSTPLFSSTSSKTTSGTTSTITTVPLSLFTFPSASIATTMTSNATSSTSAALGSTSSAPVFKFGAAPRLGTSLSSTSTTTTINTTTATVQSSTFSGLTFGTTSTTSSSQSMGIFSGLSSTNANSQANSASNLFTLGVKSSLFTGAGGGSTQLSSGTNIFGQSQSSKATSSFDSITKAATTCVNSTTTGTSNPSPFLFGAPSTSSAPSSQLTSSSTAPGKLFSFGPSSTSAPTSTPFSIPATNATPFTFGQKPATTAPTTTTLSNTGFYAFGTPGTAVATSGSNVASTVSSKPFQFGASPAISSGTGFNFSSPSSGLAGSVGSVPAFGNPAGFNFGQTTGFSNTSPSTTNPFVFGTTPPATPGTAGAVAIPRRRPTSARRTRRV